MKSKNQLKFCKIMQFYSETFAILHKKLCDCVAWKLRKLFLKVFSSFRSFPRQKRLLVYCKVIFSYESVFISLSKVVVHLFVFTILKLVFCRSLLSHHLLLPFCWIFNHINIINFLMNLFCFVALAAFYIIKKR